MEINKNNFTSKIIDETELGSNQKKYLSLIFLVIACSMSFFSYREVGFLWDTVFTFKPGVMATILGFIIASPLYLRRILKWNSSPYTIISFILILYLFASMVQFALGGEGSSSKITLYLLGTSVILSWLGMKSVAGLSWILVLIAVISSLIENDIAMGGFGFLFIFSGLIGIVLHSGMHPGNFMKSMKSEFNFEKVSHPQNLGKSNNEKLTA